MSNGPNPLSVLLSVMRSLLFVRRPEPIGEQRADHSPLRDPLQRVAADGADGLPDLEDDLASYLAAMERVDPDLLTRDEALAFWVNVYNAGALIVAGRAQRQGKSSVLRVPGGFSSNFVTVAGENLSLDDIEHGKLRRFRDPRIHAALVCGSVSCPTLRGEPYTGDDLDGQFDDQLRHFLASGAFSVDRDAAVVRLSRVFLWFGGDFGRPHRMPTFLPVSRTTLLSALTPWLDPDVADWIESTQPDVEFQPYNWGLRCVVRSP